MPRVVACCSRGAGERRDDGRAVVVTGPVARARGVAAALGMVVRRLDPLRGPSDSDDHEPSGSPAPTRQPLRERWPAPGSPPRERLDSLFRRVGRLGNRRSALRASGTLWPVALGPRTRGPLRPDHRNEDLALPPASRQGRQGRSMASEGDMLTYASTGPLAAPGPGGAARRAADELSSSAGPPLHQEAGRRSRMSCSAGSGGRTKEKWPRAASMRRSTASSTRTSYLSGSGHTGRCRCRRVMERRERPAPPCLAGPERATVGEPCA